jgi:hypothetical protein
MQHGGGNGCEPPRATTKTFGLGVGGTASRIDGRRGTWHMAGRCAGEEREARSIYRSGFMAPWLTFGRCERGRHWPRLNLPLKGAKLAPSLAV